MNDLQNIETTELDIETAALESVSEPRSVVKPAYKAKYALREAAMVRRPKGVSRKALARSSSDWLAIELAKRVLGTKDKLNMPAFEAILRINGVAPRETGNNGLRKMTGRLKLEKVVAEAGELLLPGEDAIKPPRAWIAAHAA